MPKKLFGLDPKIAVGIGAVVFVLVWWYLRRHQAAGGIATETQTVGQVPPSSSGPTDTTGGVAQSLDLSPVLDALAQQTATIGDLSSQVGSLYYSAPSTPPSTTNYITNYNGTSPPTQPGGVNPPPAAPPVAPPVPVAPMKQIVAVGPTPVYVPATSTSAPVKIGTTAKIRTAPVGRNLIA